MSRSEEFLGSQHFLGKSAKRNYGFALKKCKLLTGEDFEDLFLDQKKVHELLSLLSKELSDSSWNLYVALYKRLAKWLGDVDDEVIPKFWRKIKLKKIDWEKKLKNKWLSHEEVYKLLDVVDYPRDKAMIGVAIEGALRVGELLGLKIRDVDKTSYGYDVVVSGKTGSSSFPVVIFAPLLVHWLNMHPLKHNPEAPLFPRRIAKKKGENNRPLEESGANAALKKYCRHAGLRNISLHWLRHTKITWTAKDKNVRVSDQMAKQMFRWSKNSRMFERYTHLHGVDSKDTFLALAGVKIDQEKEEKNTILNPKKCLNCGEMNSAEFLYCSKCGFVLSEIEAENMIAEKKIMDRMKQFFIERMEKEEK